MVLSLVLHWLHLSAVVIWIGGLGFNLMILMPSIKQVDLKNRSMLIHNALPRFLKIAWVSIAIIVATGLYRVAFVNNMTTLSAFTATTYGLSLLVKIIIVAVMIVVAGVITFGMKPRIISHLSIHIGGKEQETSCVTCKQLLTRTRMLMMSVFLMSFAVIYLAAFLRGA